MDRTEKNVTPITRIKIDDRSLVLKREDLNRTGSQKDRGLPVQISKHLEEGSTSFVISSSGNSAISAIDSLRGTNATLTVFLSTNIGKSKLDRLSKLLDRSIEPVDQQIGNISMKYSSKPVSEAFKYSSENKQVLLRGSTDQYATIGYEAIAKELIYQSPLSTDIFIPTSSGTTLVGIYNGYERAGKNDNNIKIPRFHLCQTSAVNPIARYFDSDFQPTDSSIAESIVDKVAHRYQEVKRIIETTGGTGWVMDDQRIIDADSILKDIELNLAYESSLALASMIRASKEWSERMTEPIILSTGVK